MWLLEKSVKKAIESREDQGFTPSAEQMANFMAARGTSDASGSGVTSVKDRVATIAVKGVLTKSPSFMAMIFGGGNTTYRGIAEGIASANADQNVDSIKLEVDSPGGNIDGLFEALAVIEGSQKPIDSEVGNLAASAAYAIVAKTRNVRATNKAARFGSIGVVVHTAVYPEDVSVASTNAPKKAPDLKTEEGKAAVREELDALHDIFVEAIAEGRGKTPKEINAEFGQGATLLAGEALKRGMIDGVIAPESTGSPASAVSGTDNLEKRPMDVQTLKSNHPAVYQAVVAEERDRVNSFLVSGEMSGDMKTAIAAVKDGSEMTETLRMTFLMAGRNKNDIDDRQGDGDAASAADTAAALATDAEKDAIVSTNILNMAAQACSVDLEL